MNFISNMLGLSFNTEVVSTMLKEGAIVVDVRTPGEYQGGHVADSKNLPLDGIEQWADTVKGWDKPIVLCCASGMRSGRATAYLQNKGVKCENGGPWTTVNGLVEK